MKTSVLLFAIFVASSLYLQCIDAVAGASVDALTPCNKCHIPYLTPKHMKVKGLNCVSCHIHGKEGKVHNVTVTVHNRISRGVSVCALCHNMTFVDRLQLSNGSLVSFDEVAYMCGDCHDNRLQRWLIGAHGAGLPSLEKYRYSPRITSLVYDDWSLEKYVWKPLKCTESGCHDPHTPKIRGFPVFGYIGTYSELLQASSAPSPSNLEVIIATLILILLAIILWVKP